MGVGTEDSAEIEVKEKEDMVTIAPKKEKMSCKEKKKCILEFEVNPAGVVSCTSLWVPVWYCYFVSLIFWSELTLQNFFTKKEFLK